MKKTNRYLVAAAGVTLHLMLGSTYAWSVYRNPIMAETGWDQSAVAFAFSLAIFCLGLSAAFMGQLVEKFGPRVTGTISAILYAAGNILAGFALDHHSLPLLYLGYGILGGMGLGAGYITPVSTIIKWFPDKRGLATGLAIMGFGFASLLTSPIAQYLLSHIGLANTFYSFGLLYLLVMLVAAQFIVRPRQEDLKAFGNTGRSSQNKGVVGEGVLAKEAIRRPSFYLLWSLLFINISCGLGLISAASPMAQEMTGMSAESAALMVGVLGIFNGFGRLLWASLSDYIGRPLTFSLLFIVNLFLSALLLVSQIQPIFIFAMAILMTCYGAGFSLLPAYLSDLYGTKQLAILHGYSLTAWALAGLVGPVLLSWTFSLSGSYMTTLYVFIALYALGLIFSLYLGRSLKK